MISPSYTYPVKVMLIEFRNQRPSQPCHSPSFWNMGERGEM